jgi:hypothetical protein
MNINCFLDSTRKLKVYQQQLLWFSQNFNNEDGKLINTVCYYHSLLIMMVVLPGDEAMELMKTLDTELQEVNYKSIIVNYIY